MDDLVERLRGLARCEHDDHSIGYEAANYIENLKGTNSYLCKVHSGYALEHDRLLAACDRAGQERDLALEPRVERLCERYIALKNEKAMQGKDKA
jgi:hypothetical protein